ncbi:GntR family transcriptional regulator [Sporosalibacterium faouarense]|uniref:GntR family transcriptional regulator n=1 Tax=Sporosalibacterium faouarense TaxID=516123 RepID=UPI00141C28B6|nr:GntR family transcriptional regulator [Sporosalibacterium faouarense]MTI48396.1 GntR family transcriptional regulator [Bacillota bacterium]
MLDKNSAVPLYQQLKEMLQNKIEYDMKSGDALPTEPEIEELYQVSRMTVRRAIDELVLEGLVYKQQGKGTFVKDQKIIHNVERITSLTEEMADRNMPLETVSISIDEMVPTLRIRDMLRLSPDEKVVRIKRIRNVNNEPFTIMINYLRKKLVPGFLEKGLKGESLYKELEKRYNIVLQRAEETVEAREATELEAEILNINPWSPVLYLSRISYTGENIPVEYTSVTTRGDRYKYKVNLYGRQGLK